MTDRPRPATPDELEKLAATPTAFERAVVDLAARSAASVAARAGAEAAQSIARQRASQSPPVAPELGDRASWAGVRRRAAEHLVTASGAASAATPNGTFDGAPAWVLDLASEWTQAAMPVTASTSIVEVDPARGLPAIPSVTTPPTAGSQPGEKRETYSKAFVVGPATGTVDIDSTLALNWSAQLDASPAATVGWAMASAAVAGEADRQVGAALVAQGFAAADLPAALAHFTGRYLPATLLLPPAGLDALGTMTVTDLTNLGVAVRLAGVTKPVLLAPGAVLGYLAPLAQSAVEPSVLGTMRGWAIFGKVAVDPAGVAVIG